MVLQAAVCSTVFNIVLPSHLCCLGGASSVLSGLQLPVQRSWHLEVCVQPHPVAARWSGHSHALKAQVAAHGCPQGRSLKQG
jgi:hypothetical protein